MLTCRRQSLGVLAVKPCHHHGRSPQPPSSLRVIFQFIWPVYCLRCGVIRQLTSGRESNGPLVLWAASVPFLLSPSALQAPGFATSVAPHPHLMSWELLPECFWQPRGSDIWYKSNPSPGSHCLARKWEALGLASQQVKTPATMPNYLG